MQQNPIPDTYQNETHVPYLKPIRTTSRLCISYNSQVWTKECYPKGEKWNMVANFVDKLWMNMNIISRKKNI